MENSQLIPVSNEEDLDKRSKRDDYWITRIMKFAVLGLILTFGVIVLLGFINRFILESIFRNQILDLIKNNIIGIVFFCLSFLGIKYSQNK